MHLNENGTSEQHSTNGVVDLESKVRQRLESYDQTHLLKFYSELSQSEKGKLLSDIASVDFEDIKQFFLQAANLDWDQKIGPTDESRLSPVEKDIVGSVHDPEAEAYRSRGLSAIASNSVCVLLLAGGQGTRLGVNYPKGMFDVGLPSGKTLYQIQAERILKIQKLADKHAGHSQPTAVIPWYIMTSEHTKEATEKFFDSRDYFGLDRSNVVFFEQNMIPCIDFQGKVLLESKCKLARSPDGNGGLYRAMRECQVVEDMERRGVEHINIYGVDNILVRIADPVFIGFAISKQADCANKVLLKNDPHERVGVVCKLDNNYKVVEYSEIPNEVSEKRDADGKLLYGASNIVNHYLSFQFAHKMCLEESSLLSYHEAKKKIPYLDVETGKMVESPSGNTGLKREKFVFDVFPYTKKFAMLEVDRESEFAPLKNDNSAGTECPDTSRAAIYKLHSRWMLQNGAKIIAPPSSNGDGCSFPKSPKTVLSNSDEGDRKTDVEFECEISPLVSYAGEGLEELCKDKEFTPPICIN